MVKITINGQVYEVPDGISVKDAARRVGIKIPALCHISGFPPIGACRLCIVQVEGRRDLPTSCELIVADGMRILTHTPDIIRHRKTILQMILSEHPCGCHTCVRNQSCKLLKLARLHDIEDNPFACNNYVPQFEKDFSSPSIIRDPNKCIGCQKCSVICNDVQSVGAITILGRGDKKRVGLADGSCLSETSCVNCGQCIHVCPVGVLSEQPQIEQVLEAVTDREKHVIVQTAPAVRVAVGEMLGMPPGANATGKMYSALRRLGFDKVFDTNFTADLTILEEGTELIRRITMNTGPLPLVTSCCPAWIKFAETFFPDLLANISTCKSPQQMFGALAKTYYARKLSIDPSSIVVVSVMPCTAKKFEAQRPEMDSSGFRDVDYVLTTRELVRMIRMSGIDFPNLDDSGADSLLGSYTGAATIFGATGGVAEAALRTVYMKVRKEELASVDFLPVRGLEGIKEAEVDLGALKARVAVAHGLGNARKLLEQVRAGVSPYHFIEVMACPGGCVGGGGQPLGFDMKRRGVRAEGLYGEDAMMTLRRSHENEEVIRLYAEYLLEPCGHLSHELLHTHYRKR